MYGIYWYTFKPVKSNSSSKEAMDPEHKRHEEKQYNYRVDSVRVCVCVCGEGEGGRGERGKGDTYDVCSLRSHFNPTCQIQRGQKGH